MPFWRCRTQTFPRTERSPSHACSVTTGENPDNATSRRCGAEGAFLIADTDHQGPERRAGDRAKALAKLDCGIRLCLPEGEGGYGVADRHRGGRVPEHDRLDT